jgi:hypothetical protein
MQHQLIGKKEDIVSVLHEGKGSLYRSVRI